MVANDMQKMIAEHEAAEAGPEIVAWRVSDAPITVYCGKCVTATVDQQQRWCPLYINKPWPKPCAICGATP